jgi:tetratricopeptide (TPR) repeat protein
MSRPVVIAVLLAGLSLSPVHASTIADAEKRGPDVKRVRSLLDEAEAALAGRRLEDAAGLFQRALDIATTRRHPNLPLARAIDGLADVHRLQRRFVEAEKLYLRSVEMWAELLGEKQPRLAVTLHNLGVVCIELGRPADAEPHLGRALAIWEATLGPESPEALNTRRALARL